MTIVMPQLTVGRTYTINMIDSLVGNGIKTFVISATGGTPQISFFGWTENTSRIRDVTI